MAVLEISSWQTYCSECHLSTGWTPTHETNYGYDMTINGTPGCGAVFTGVRFQYINLLEPDKDPRVDNDRYPQWMKDLPLV
jgi:hypothetical protein